MQTGAAMKKNNWWRGAVIYQIYPRSFLDTNGDGVGDLPGIVEKLDYIAGLGVDAIWISPFFKSPMADFGYDIADYRDVDPMFGTLADFDALLVKAHALGIKVMIDQVLSHCSVEHAWFKESRESRDNPKADWYVWADPKEDGTPPNNWMSLFGGVAWRWEPRREQYYLHNFLASQPDLNFHNPAVRAAVLSDIRFWLDRGIDGFRIDVSDALIKDTAWEDTPDGNPLIPKDDASGVHEIYRAFRAVMDSYDGDRMAVIETGAPDDVVALFLRPDEMHLAFNFRFVKAGWDAAAIRAAVDDSLAAYGAVGAPTTWVTDNHDTTRSVTRYGADVRLEGEYVPGSTAELPLDDAALARGTRRARAMAVLLLGLPGAAYVYAGQELGLPEVVDLPAEVLQDPIVARSGGTSRGRDGCRVPLPWTAADEPALADFSRPAPADDGTGENHVPLCAAGQFGTGASFGFSPAVRADGVTPAADPHLPQPLWFKDYAVDVEQADPDSMYTLYHAALAIRQESLTATRDTTAEQVDMGADVVAYRRAAVEGRTFTSVTNFGTAPVSLPEGSVVLTSGPLTPDGQLPTDTSAWVIK